MKWVVWHGEKNSGPLDELNGISFSPGQKVRLKSVRFHTHMSEEELAAICSKLPIVFEDDAETVPAEPTPEPVVDEEPKTEDVDDDVPFTDDSNPEGGEL